LRLGWLRLGWRQRLGWSWRLLDILALVRGGERWRPGCGNHPGLGWARGILDAHLFLYLVLLLLRRLDDLVRHLRGCRRLLLLLLEQSLIGCLLLRLLLLCGG
jgi:hypothetical protein